MVKMIWKGMLYGVVCCGREERGTDYASRKLAEGLDTQKAVFRVPSWLSGEECRITESQE